MRTPKRRLLPTPLVADISRAMDAGTQRIADLTAQLAERDAQLAAMREALEHCLHRPHEHNPEPEFTITQCEVIDRALAPDAGKALLERLAAMRSAIEEALEHTMSATVQWNDPHPNHAAETRGENADKYVMSAWKALNAALAPDAGKALLERLEKAEKELAHAKTLREMVVERGELYSQAHDQGLERAAKVLELEEVSRPWAKAIRALKGKP